MILFGDLMPLEPAPASLGANSIVNGIIAFLSSNSQQGVQHDIFGCDTIGAGTGII